MIDKDKIYCLKLIETGPFFEEFVVSFACANEKSPYFFLRAMKKKQITANKVDEEMVMLELAIRTNIRHPFLVNQIFAFQDYDILYYISEYAHVQILRSGVLPKKFSYEMVRFYTAEIFSCLKYLHSKGQNYTYLCPKNVLLAPDGHVKLNYSFCNCIEYSLSDIMENVEYSSFDYITNKRFSYLSDYWSLGVFIYEMVLGYPPFTGVSFDHTVVEIKKCKLTFPGHVNPILKDFIHMLVDNKLATKFPSCELLEKAIENHPMLAGFDFKKLYEKGYEPPFTFQPYDYDLRRSPKLNVLYTTDFYEGDNKDGYGRIFAHYNAINFIAKRRSKHRYSFQ